jgi:hypothetical protein
LKEAQRTHAESVVASVAAYDAAPVENSNYDVKYCFGSQILPRLGYPWWETEVMENWDKQT